LGVELRDHRGRWDTEDGGGARDAVAQVSRRPPMPVTAGRQVPKARGASAVVIVVALSVIVGAGCRAEHTDTTTRAADRTIARLHEATSQARHPEVVAVTTGSGVRRPIVIGAASTTESALLATIYAKALGAK